VHDPRLPRREWLGWATTDRDGRPHLVPYSALDRKQKRSSKLRRIGNALARLDLTILVDHYEEDWGRIWWIRLRGRARVPTAARSETALSHSCRRSIRVPHKLTIRSTREGAIPEAKTLLRLPACSRDRFYVLVGAAPSEHGFDETAELGAGAVDADAVERARDRAGGCTQHAEQDVRGHEATCGVSKSAFCLQIVTSRDAH
jgi:hypothetical protein